MSAKAQVFQTLLAGLSYSGVTASGYVVYFVDAGTAPSIASLKTIYLDQNKAQTAANPYTLDANGRAELYLDGIYDVIVMDAVGGTVKDTWLSVQTSFPTALESITVDRRNAGSGTVNVSIVAANDATATVLYIGKALADTSANSVVITPTTGTIGGLPQWTISNAGEYALLIPVATDNDYSVK